MRHARVPHSVAQKWNARNYDFAVSFGGVFPDLFGDVLGSPEHRVLQKAVGAEGAVAEVDLQGGEHAAGDISNEENT